MYRVGSEVGVAPLLSLGLSHSYSCLWLMAAQYLEAEVRKKQLDTWRVELSKTFLDFCLERCSGCM